MIVVKNKHIFATFENENFFIKLDYEKNTPQQASVAIGATTNASEALCICSYTGKDALEKAENMLNDTITAIQSVIEDPYATCTLTIQKETK